MTICKALLDAGAHVNFGGRSGRFPLYIAARKGDLQMAQLLMSAGASIDMQYVTGEILLHDYLQVLNMRQISFIDIDKQTIYKFYCKYNVSSER